MSKKNPTSFGRKGQSTMGTVAVVILALLGWWFNGTLPGVDPSTADNEPVVSQVATATLAPLTEKGETGSDGDSTAVDGEVDAAPAEAVEQEETAQEEAASTDTADTAATDADAAEDAAEDADASGDSSEADSADSDNSEADSSESEAVALKSAEAEADPVEDVPATEVPVVNTPTPEPLPTDTATPKPTATAVPKPTSTPTPAPARGPPGMPEIYWDDLPPEARYTIELIWQNGPFPYRQDDSDFQNREGILPSEPRGYYREFTVVTPGARTRGARRIVEGENGELYYTDDHYDSFSWVVTE